MLQIYLKSQDVRVGWMLVTACYMFYIYVFNRSCLFVNLNQKVIKISKQGFIKFILIYLLSG